MENIEALNKVHIRLGGRLKICILPSTSLKIIVSIEQLNGFKRMAGELSYKVGNTLSSTNWQII